MSDHDDPTTCPTCKSVDPNMVGYNKSSGKCRNPFHCPSPETHGNPFRYCQYCTWEETP